MCFSKATLFGLPEPGTIFEQRMIYYILGAQRAGVPICFCEYNIKQYADEDIDDLNQENVNYFFEKFKNENIWGWALWIWDYKPRDNPNFVFVDFNNDGLMTTNDNFEYIKNANIQFIENKYHNQYQYCCYSTSSEFYQLAPELASRQISLQMQAQWFG